MQPPGCWICLGISLVWIQVVVQFGKNTFFLNRVYWSVFDFLILRIKQMNVIQLQM